MGCACFFLSVSQEAGAFRPCCRRGDGLWAGRGGDGGGGDWPRGDTAAAPREEISNFAHRRREPRPKKKEIKNAPHTPCTVSVKKGVRHSVQVLDAVSYARQPRMPLVMGL